MPYLYIGGCPFLIELAKAKRKIDWKGVRLTRLKRRIDWIPRISFLFEKSGAGANNSRGESGIGAYNLSIDLLFSICSTHTI